MRASEHEYAVSGEGGTLSGGRSPQALPPQALRLSTRVLAVVGLVGMLVVICALFAASTAQAAVSISRAESSGGQLRIEGQARANTTITVDGVAMSTSDGSGKFRIDRSGYTPPADCTVDVNDGSATAATARLSGCTVSSTPPPPPPADTTAPTAPTNLTATVTGTTANLSWTASTDNVGVTGYRVTRNGTVLPGTTSDTTFSDASLAAGTYTYTVAAVDGAGNVSGASNSASVTVGSAEPLTFLTPPQMPDATVGQAYLGYIVASDPPGPSTFKFKLVSGTLPDGTRFVKNTLENRPEARVVGTPSRAGTFSFTVEVEDNTGATARRTFSIRVI